VAKHVVRLLQGHGHASPSFSAHRLATDQQRLYETAVPQDTPHRSAGLEVIFSRQHGLSVSQR